MIIVIDVDYGETEACVAGVFAQKTDSKESCGFLRLKIKDYGDYKSGQFYNNPARKPMVFRPWDEWRICE